MATLSIRDIASSSPSDIAMLLQSMGQTSVPSAPAETPIDPMEEALIKGVDPVGNLPKTQEGVNALLRSMGMSMPANRTPESVSTPTTSAVPASGELLKQIVMQEAASGIGSAVSAPANADPLAADVNGWNLPKTGQVETRGAVQRITARAKAEGTGVTATKDAKGQLTITNLSPDGSFNPAGQVSSAPLPMTAAIANLRKTENTAEAAVIMDSIRATAAAENARITTEAMKFASNKLGIPQWEARLAQAELADRNNPAWFPGIGDSPNTKAVRTQLGTLQNDAKNQAELFLATNLSAGVLKSQLTAASEEMKRIERKQTQKETVALARETAGIARVARKEEKEERELEEAQAIAKQLSPKDRAVLVTLNPSLAAGTDKDMAKAVLELDKPANKPRKEAILAASSGSVNDLIGLSVEGNIDALTLLQKQEEAINGKMNKDTFDAALGRIKLLSDPKNTEAYIKAKYGVKANSKEAQEERATLNAEIIKGGDAKDKALARRSRIGTAIQIERKRATDNFLGNVNAWGTTDPTWEAATLEAKKTRGVTDFQTVMDVYLGSSTGEEAQKKLFAIKTVAEEALARQTGSIFGAPNDALVYSLITQKAKNVGLGKSLVELASKIATTAFNALPLIGPGVQAAQALAPTVSAATGQFNVQVDPVTGQPLAR